MRSPNTLIQCIAIASLLLNASPLAAADTRIRGEFEYNVDDSELSEWQIGPVFALPISSQSESSEIELELPIGQDEGVWLVQPELSYEVDIDDLKVEFSVGLEAPFNGDPIEGFGGIEGSVDF